MFLSIQRNVIHGDISPKKYAKSKKKYFKRKNRRKALDNKHLKEEKQIKIYTKTKLVFVYNFTQEEGHCCN